MWSGLDRPQKAGTGPHGTPHSPMLAVSSAEGRDEGSSLHTKSSTFLKREARAEARGDGLGLGAAFGQDGFSPTTACHYNRILPRSDVLSAND